MKNNIDIKSLCKISALDIEDKDTQETVIQKFEDKINAILESKYYKKNENKLAFDLIIPKKTLELIKSAAGIF